VWVSWWLTPWQTPQQQVFDQGRLIRSTWLTNPTGYPRSWPLVSRTTASRGAAVWNKWWFNTPYTAPPRATVYTFIAGGAIYGYAGGAALLGGLINYQLLAQPGSYNFAGASSMVDVQLDADALTYTFAGVDTISLNPLPPLIAEGGYYSYADGGGSQLFFGHYIPVPPDWQSRVVLSAKKAGESLVIPMDFMGRLGAGEIIKNVATSCSVYSGTDPNPGAMLVGVPAIGGSIVEQLVRGGVEGVIYKLMYTVTTDTPQSVQLAGYLAVEPDLP
jgi:hypothetical protein